MYVLKNNFKMLKIAHAVDKFRLPVTLLMVIFDTVNYVVTKLLFLPIIVFFIFTDSFDWFNFIVVIIVVIIVGGISKSASSYFDNVYIPQSNAKISQHAKKIIYDRAALLKLKYYDTSEHYDELQFIISDSSGRVISVLNNFYAFFSLITLIIFATSVMIYINPIIIIFIVISAVLEILANSLIKKVNFQFTNDRVSQDKKFNYAIRVFYLPDYAKEIRMFGVSGLIFTLFNNAFTEILNIQKKYALKEVVIRIVVNVLTIVSMLSAPLLYLAYIFISQEAIQPAQVVLVTETVVHLTMQVQFLFGVGITLLDNNQYIQRYFSFMDRELEEDSAVCGFDSIRLPDSPKEIAISDLSFSYPSHKRIIFNGLDMLIPPQKKIGIVGRNGSGKSTILKLLLRLYDPNKGAISLDNRDISVYGIDDYRKKIGVLFQDFQLYDISVAENVLMEEYTDENEYIVKNALQLSQLSNTIKSYTITVGRELTDDGLMLSGGEKQKLALSRIFTTDRHYIFLDEPSSSLDITSEKQMYEAVWEFATQKSMIIISHELSVTKNCDHIYYIADNVVKEQGTHDELMRLKGAYFEMYTLQAHRFVGGAYD